MTHLPHKKSYPILIKFLIPMLIVMLIQAVLFAGTIVWGGTIKQLKRNSYDILNERVLDRRLYLQSEMMLRWSNITEPANTVQAVVQNYLDEQHISLSELLQDSHRSAEVVNTLVDPLIQMMRTNSVTGAFLILDSNFTDSSDKEENIAYKAGVYIRDLDPAVNPSNHSDLLLERGSASIARQYGITMDTQWMPYCMVATDHNRQQHDYFYKPLAAARNYPYLESQYAGYWNPPYQLSDNDIPAISYSLPLISEQGEPYGVIGISITLDYLSTLLPSYEINSDNNGIYMIGVEHNQDLDFELVVSSGSKFEKKFANQEQIPFEVSSDDDQIYETAGSNQDSSPVYSSIQYLNLYPSNTPFADEQWALIGMVDKSELLKFPQQMQVMILTSLVISFVIGIIGVTIAAAIYTKPITKLAHKVKTSNPQEPVILGKLYINEIDDLASSIESLSVNVADFASKLSQIISMVNVPIGAFESNRKTGRAYCTSTFFELMNWDRSADDSSYVTREELIEHLSVLERCTDKDMEDTYRIEDEKGNLRWIRINTLEDEHRVLGVIVDVTHETQVKYKIEYERDYDLLTSLLNRRAFHRLMREKLEHPEQLGIAAFMMWDLDNLKMINDTYGHDYGDEYIKLAASILKKFDSYNGLTARMSGDEFFVFLSGYSSQDEIREIVNRIRHEMDTTILRLPDHEPFKLKSSSGLAWYPQDSADYEQLIKYADFAMYEVKRKEKGGNKEFDKNSYLQDAGIIQSKQALNRLIQEQLVDYAFQPIIDAHTGEIFGYELLMRPQLEALKSPIEVLKAAAAQSQLYEIERLTWMKGLEACGRYGAELYGKHLFMNSIPNCILSDQDQKLIIEQNSALFSKIVVVMTESEQMSAAVLQEKLNQAEAWNCSTALDGFGAEYKHDQTMLLFTPDYVKLHMSLIRGIDQEPNRQKLLRRYISYAKERNIQVVAEGIETKEEMDMVIAYGVDYLQGYYIARPDFYPQKAKPELVEEIRGTSC